MESLCPILVFPYIVPSFYNSIVSLSFRVQALGHAKHFEYKEACRKCSGNGRTRSTSISIGPRAENGRMIEDRVTRSRYGRGVQAVE